jgi:type I restriction enzyme S subunit
VKLPAYPRTKPSGVEWLGDVPEHWEVDRLKRSSLRVTDGAHISPDLSSPDFPFVSTVDLSGGKIDFDGCLRTSDECYSYLVRTGCRPHQGDLLFSKDGTVGRTAVVDVDREFVVASSLVIVSPKPAKLDVKFLDCWLNNSLLQQDILLQMSGAALRRVSVEKVSRLPVWLPPIVEQRSIAAFLDRETGRVDRLVAKKRELIERLKEKRTALISRTVTRGLPPAAARAAGLPANPPLKPSALDWLGDIPAHWEFKKLRYLCEITTGDKDTIDAVDEGAFPFFVRSQTIERIDSYSFDCEAVLTAGDGVGVGKVFHHHQGKFAVHQRVYVLHNFRKVSGRYLFMFMKEFFARVALGGEAKSTVDSLRRPIFTDFVVLLPPLPEQTAIAGYLDEETAKLDALVGKVEEAVERLQEYRTALITAAVTGKIDVRKVVAA